MLVVEFPANQISLGAAVVCWNAAGADPPEKKYEGCSLLDALQHALLGQVVCTVVVPYLKAQHSELEVDGVCLVLCMNVGGKSVKNCGCGSQT